MKQILVFSLIILVISSCNDDDKKKDKLEGTWLPVTEIYADCDDEADNETINYDDNGCDDDECVEVTFKDGTMTMKITEDGDTDMETYAYTIDGGYVTFSDGVDDLTAIFNATDKTLALTYEDYDGGCVMVITYKIKH